MTSPIHPLLPRLTNRCARLPALLLCLLAPAFCSAQDIGQVACARPGDYVYLYSSMVTLDIRTTLQCDQQIEITGRYESYFGVRTAKGEIGYVPVDSLLLLKTKLGAKPTLPPTKEPVREKTPYDEPTKPPVTSFKAPESNLVFTLRDSTPIRMKLTKSISSADDHVGDDVSFEVAEDVVIDGLLVIAKGAAAVGVINEAEPKKALGRGGKLSVLINSVALADKEEARLRSGGEGKGSGSAAGAVIPVVHGKDVVFPKGKEFTAYVNGDRRFKRENFRAAADTGDPAVPALASTTPHF